MIKPMSLVDLISWATMVVDVSIESNALRGLVAFRLLRLLSLSRLERNHNFMHNIIKVVTLKRAELFATMGVAVLLLLIVSTAMYYIENDANPQFASIFHSMWWGTTALTTVGYGDVVPITPLGRVLGSIVAFIGVGLFGMPTGILASGFQELHDDRARERDRSSGRSLSSSEDIVDNSPAGASNAAALHARLEKLESSVGLQMQSLQADVESIRQGQAHILALLQELARPRQA